MILNMHMKEILTILSKQGLKPWQVLSGNSKKEDTGLPWRRQGKT